MDTIPDGVLLIDVDGKILHANPVARHHLTLFAPSSAQARTLTTLGGRPLAELLRPPTNGRQHEIETDGHIFEAAAQPVGDQATSESWVLVLRDVTHERETQQHMQQQERLSAIGRLAAGIAHDFNNIMTVIMLYAQMGMRTLGVPTRLLEQLLTIKDQAAQTADLIQQILDFSRRAVLERQALDLRAVLDAQIQRLQRTLPENIAIRFTHGPHNYIVDADPTRIQQVVMNLTLNARDAMPDGGDLHIDLTQLDIAEGDTSPLSDIFPGTWLCLRVSDTGTGIPDEIIDHIFEPFFTTKAPIGTGLGLAQVYGIVKQHSDHIDVESTPGAGTTFTLYLPALQNSAGEIIATDPQTLVHGRGQTLLLAEDNDALREALTQTLQDLDYCVLEAGDGEESLAILDAHPGEIDLVIADLIMPKMGGQVLFRALKQHPSNLPVIIITGHPLEQQLKQLEAEGLTGWLLKPPNIKQLAQLLVDVLEKE